MPSFGAKMLVRYYWLKPLWLQLRHYLHYSLETKPLFILFHGNKAIVYIIPYCKEAARTLPWSLYRAKTTCFVAAHTQLSEVEYFRACGLLRQRAFGMPQ